MSDNEPDMFGQNADESYWASDSARPSASAPVHQLDSDSDDDVPTSTGNADVASVPTTTTTGGGGGSGGVTEASSNFQAVDIGDGSQPVDTTNEAADIAAAGAKNWGVNPECIQSFQGHEKDIRAIHINRDGTIFSAGDDKSVCLWSKGIDGNYKLGVSQPTPAKATALEWDQNRRWLLVGLDNGLIVIYEVNPEYTRATETRQIQAHSARVTNIVYDEPFDRIISAGRDKKLSIFDLIQNTHVATRCGNAWIDALAYDRPGNRVFLGTYAQTIIVMDTAANPPKQLFELKGGHKGSIRSLFYEPKSRYLLSGSFDKTVCAWSIGPKGKEMLAKVTAKFVGHKDKVKAVVYSPKSKRLFTAGDDRSIVVWDAVTGEQLSVTPSHKSTIPALLWQEHSGQLITCSHDRTIKIWQFPEAE